MPRIEDIARIWETWSALKENLEDRGYQPGAISVDQAVTDRRMALFTTCPECGRPCNYVGFNKNSKYYRSYVVCFSCDTAAKLSSEG